jgi:acetyl-CoA synthetase
MRKPPESHHFDPQRIPLVDESEYKRLYEWSIADPEGFWSHMAKTHIDWFTLWDTVQTGSPEDGNVTWFDGATLNVCYNCIDRHVLQGHGETIAYKWEGNGGDVKKITYAQMLDAVSCLANVLKERGVQKGDRVCIYMPMIPEAVYAMLACARIGAVHSVVFGGFSAEALASRINDADCKVVITADISRRGDKIIALKEQVHEALKQCPQVTTTLLVRTSDVSIPVHHTDVDYATSMEHAQPTCEPESMSAEDPLFILYTSGSTGKPKGVVHTTAGYLLYVALTYKYGFDYQPGDVYWCMADIGWITGHSYVVYGPLSNRATSIIYEGVPTYPNASRVWNIVDKHKVNILYSTPTAIRSLMTHGDEYVTGSSRESLRILGTVGEPINLEAWQWYFNVVGGQRCPIVDTWWQTETGGFVLLPLPWAGPQKPGYCMRPFFGIRPVIINEEGKELQGEVNGILALRGTWPSMIRTLWNDHERFQKTYFKVYPGYYFTGDGAKRDSDGHFQVTGRIDDALNISGHLIGTAEVESTLTKHKGIAEVAVIGIPHVIKGESMVAFVVLKKSQQLQKQNLVAELQDIVKMEIGSFAKPDIIKFVPELPKTRSGKIRRRILRKIALGKTDELGDISTLVDTSIIEKLI